MTLLSGMCYLFAVFCAVRSIDPLLESDVFALYHRYFGRSETRETMKDTIELTIESKYEFVELVGSVTKGVTEMLGFDDEASSWIDLSIRESVINAIKHGNRLDPGKRVGVKFSLENPTLTVYVRDEGSGFDPLIVADPLDPDNLMNPSGRGIFYMRTFMDEVDFSRHPEGGTVVRMVKRRSDPETKGESGSDGSSHD